MKKITFISFFLLISITSTFAQIKLENPTLGGSLSFSNEQKIGGELYAQLSTKLFGCKFEPKGGFNYSPFSANFLDVKDLTSGSLGFFLEGSIYPFQKYFFTGIRWEIVDINWFTPNAVDKLKKTMESPPLTFSGMRFYGVVGLDFPVSKTLNLRAYGMPGFQNYGIPVNYMGNVSREYHTQFTFQMNIGIALKLPQQ